MHGFSSATGKSLTTVSRKPPRYDVPNAAPDPLRTVQAFVNTTDLEHRRERLVTPDDLGGFLAERGLSDAQTAVTFAGLRRARELREALRALLVANSGGPEPAAALEVLNAEARRARLTLQFPAPAVAEVVVLAAGTDAALGRILAIAAASMHDGSWPRLKACPNCRWAFYDHSRNRSATWCSMTLCGNRLKTRAYRRRRRAMDEASRRPRDVTSGEWTSSQSSSH